MKSLPKVVVVTVGAIGLLAGVLGLCYNGMAAYAMLHGPALPAFPGTSPSPADVTRAFFIMSAICVSCYLIVVVCSVGLIRQRLRWSTLLIGVLVFEVLYFFAIGALWLHPTQGLAIGAATGIANGGMMVQFLVLFPLWAPPALLWAKSRYPLS